MAGEDVWAGGCTLSGRCFRSSLSRESCRVGCGIANIHLFLSIATV